MVFFISKIFIIERPSQHTASGVPVRGTHTSTEAKSIYQKNTKQPMHHASYKRNHGRK